MHAKQTMDGDHCDCGCEYDDEPRLLPVVPPFDMAKGREILTQLAALQQSDGSYKMDERFASIVEVDLKELKSECETSGFDEDAFATVLAMTYFVRRLAPLKREWLRRLKRCNAWIFTTHDSGPFQTIPKQEAMFMAALFKHIQK